MPHVSEKFWDQHPEWREKTALLQDAQLDWRKLVNLTNRDAFTAVSSGVHDLLSRFDPSRSRLRTYLRVCIDGLVSNHDKAAGRQKRGGGMEPVPFDFEEAREELERVAGTVESAESLFEKEWARGVFATALQRLRDACEEAGKAGHYALLEQYDLDDAHPTYAELAQRFGIAVTDVTNRLFRVRRELRHVVLEVLRELTASEEEFLEEARALLGEDAA